MAFRNCAEIFLLKVRFLHQPMCKSAQNLGMRASILETTRPQPDMITEKLGDASFADTIEDQSGLPSIPHQGMAPAAWGFRSAGTSDPNDELHRRRRQDPP